MNVVEQVFNFIKQLFEWYFMVNPQEQAIFVRAGKHSKVLNSGIYFKIPFIDRVYIQSIRLITRDVSPQSITTKCGATVTVKLMVQYSITDILQLYNSISHPDLTIGGIIMSEMAEAIRSKRMDEIDLSIIESDITNKLDTNKFGIGNVKVSVISWANVKTYRLIQDQGWMYEQTGLEPNKK